MRATCRRRDGGQPLRDAISARKLSLQAVAALTKELDERGHGVSFQLISFLATSGKSARETTSIRSAALIAKALGVPEGSLFVREEADTPDSSTHERAAVDAA